jgi:hypothetical protein
MRSLLAPLAAALVIATALTGCDDGDGGGAGTPSAFGNSFATAQCDLLRTCCAETDAPVDYDCEGHFREQMNLAQQAVNAGFLQYDAAAAEECLAWFEANGSACASADAPACGRVFVEAGGGRSGGAGPGEACEFDEDCAASDEGELLCDFRPGGEQSVCVLHVRAAEGEPCRETCEVISGGGYGCGSAVFDSATPERVGQCWRDDGVVCEERSGTCVALGTEGSECERTNECAPPYFCGDADDGQGTRICRQPGYEGAPCERGVEGACGPDRFCNEEGACADRLEAGAACNPAGDDVCAVGTSCDAERMTCAATGGDLGCGLVRSLATGESPFGR